MSEKIPCSGLRRIDERRFEPCPEEVVRFTRSTLTKSVGLTPRHRAWCLTHFEGVPVQFCIKQGSLVSVSRQEWEKLETR